MAALDFPLQIAIAGAPGSGKQRLIDEFIALAGDWFEENGSPLHVVKNSGTVIEETYGQAMGTFGSYVEDFWAFWNRYQREEELRNENKSFITGGTPLDNLAHAGVNLEGLLVGLQTPETQQRVQRQQVAMTALTFLFFDRFKYKFGFFLPYVDSVIVPGSDDFEANYSARVDQALRMIFANFNLRIQVLDQPSFEEKAAEMFDTIKRIYENGPELPEPAAAEELPPEPVDTLSE